MAQGPDVMAELRLVFCGVFLDDDIQINAKMTAGDVGGWDSLNNISLMVAVQAHFGIKLSIREIDSLKNIGDLAKCVTMKLAA
jgi:acyl carrier protein